ncbi:MULTISPECIES: hypothetical protein [Actinomadura]|uniref:Secreted protein n=1 Tax=Actinomadura yumaensis TaxID=111807 RepID=A0ABW2CST5_9ACTN|nr:hypothetical protein [Actinomadura sp. J1-007]MWK40422.1 hypothetical protein [Actinomadura sp. J1-007]
MDMSTIVTLAGAGSQLVCAVLSLAVQIRHGRRRHCASHHPRKHADAVEPAAPPPTRPPRSADADSDQGGGPIGNPYGPC